MIKIYNSNNSMFHPGFLGMEINVPDPYNPMKNFSLEDELLQAKAAIKKHQQEVATLESNHAATINRLIDDNKNIHTESANTKRKIFIQTEILRAKSEEIEGYKNSSAVMSERLTEVENRLLAFENEKQKLTEYKSRLASMVVRNKEVLLDATKIIKGNETLLKNIKKLILNFSNTVNNSSPFFSEDDDVLLDDDDLETYRTILDEIQQLIQALRKTSRSKDLRKMEAIQRKLFEESRNLKREVTEMREYLSGRNVETASLRQEILNLRRSAVPIRTFIPSTTDKFEKGIEEEDQVLEKGIRDIKENHESINTFKKTLNEISEKYDFLYDINMHVKDLLHLYSDTFNDRNRHMERANRARARAEAAELRNTTYLESQLDNVVDRFGQGSVIRNTQGRHRSDMTTPRGIPYDVEDMGDDDPGVPTNRRLFH